ncbi:manganese-binding transcriptional regulator MntR [Sphingomonas bacterium]|uniref:manganese-binding transcriptional regulator MntR n=1 Tax=Sphingomonas bacterium TaxID=1895847 RepID=UPI0015765096|nr:manganese-binding transcriptional regulator MntR [Sphingomonas bacterium]
MTDPSFSDRRAVAFRATREAHATEMAEDYVELIGDLIADHGEARLTDVAGHMGVTQPTAAKVIARLKTLGLVDGRRYRSLFLTEKGKAIADRSRARHKIVVDFLRSLGVSRDTAEIDAEGIEHHVSDETLAVLKGALASNRG